MTADAFELSPSASSSMPAQAALYGNRFIQALVATLLLGGLLALSVDLLLLYISLPDATGDSPGWLQRYDAAYFLTLAANGLSDLWIIALSAWLMVGYLFERNGQIRYRRPRPLLLSLLLISLGFTLVINLLHSDPMRRSFLRWEAYDPVPPPKPAPKPRPGATP